MRMKKWIEKADEGFILWLREYGDDFARFAIFLVFGWFGFLKIIGASPAGPLVETLLNATFLAGLNPELFVITFGGFEVILGLLFLIPKLERLVLGLLIFHLITTVMPLALLPDIAWAGIFVPTLEGQYIIKNILILALALMTMARLHPMTQTHNFFAE